MSGDVWQRTALFALLMGAAAVSLGAATPIPVVLSTDVGNEIDDQWAIVYLMTNPAFDVRGLISAHAPSVRPPAAHTSYLLLRDIIERRMGMPGHPPILEGSSLPLATESEPRPSEGADFIVDASRGFTPDHRLTVLTIGAVTDLASALLRDPALESRIRVVDMGFTRWPDGGDEYNVANDVKAMQVLLASNVPLVVGSGDVCRAFLNLSYGQAKDLIAEHGPVGQWLWAEYQDWYYRHVKPLRKDDFSKGWVIWDIITLAYLEDMTKSTTYSRPVLRDDMVLDHPATDRTITWITSVDSQRLWTDFIHRLDEYQRTHAVQSYPALP